MFSCISRKIIYNKGDDPGILLAFKKLWICADFWVTGKKDMTIQLKVALFIIAPISEKNIVQFFLWKFFLLHVQIENALLLNPTSISQGSDIDHFSEKNI